MITELDTVFTFISAGSPNTLFCNSLLYSRPFLIPQPAATWVLFIFSINFELLPCDAETHTEIATLIPQFYFTFHINKNNPLALPPKYILNMTTSHSHHFFSPPAHNNSQSCQCFLSVLLNVLKNLNDFPAPFPICQITRVAS